MRLKTKNILYLFLLLLLSCCGEAKKEGDMTLGQKIIGIMGVKAMKSTMYPEIPSEERRGMADFYRAVESLKADKVQECLDNGSDPDVCLGPFGWIQHNPLDVVVKSFYATYARKKYGEIIPTLVPDVEILEILVRGGADINRRPYIWHRVRTWNNNIIDGSLDRLRAGPAENDEFYETFEEAGYRVIGFVEDANRLIEAFIEAGVDPNKLGHPYPYYPKDEDIAMSDEEANAYFAKGTRPINEAIKKGMIWESQVDLLLRYTKLDEASLEAARESGDPAMIEKITRLWEEQRK